jgi:hypothetical protein
VLDGVGMVRAWPFEQLLEVVRGALCGHLLALSLRVATSEAPCRCFFFPERSEVPSSVSPSRLVLPREQLKIAPTAFSLETWLVAMSRSSLVVCGPLHPSLWTRDL